MAYYKIQWKKSAIKELYNIGKDAIPRIITAIDSLAKNPRPSGVKKLSESERTYRLRVGSYRVIYELEEEKLIIQIIRVRHRKDAYRP